MMIGNTGRSTNAGSSDAMSILQSALDQHKSEQSAILQNNEDYTFIEGIIKQGNYMTPGENIEEIKNMQLQDGCIFTGQVSTQSNLKHGFGAQLWPDGAKYIGEWIDGKAEGQGTFYHTNGDIFMG